MSESESGEARSMGASRLEWCIRHAVIVGFMGLLPLAAIFGFESDAEARPDSVTQTARQQRQHEGDAIQRLPATEIADEAWFQQARSDLQTMGVNYVRLERVSEQPNRYRFACQLGEPHRIPGRSPEIITYGNSPQGSVAAALDRLRAQRPLAARSDSPQSGEFN